MMRPGTKRRTEDLVEALSSPEGEVRHRAYQDLLEIGREALPAVRDGLGHESWQVRRRCAMVVDQIADPESLRRLIPLLDDPHRKVRLWAVHSISCDPCKDTVENPVDVVPLLIRRMLADRSVIVRRMATAMLANHHPDPRSFGAFRKLLEADEDLDEKVRRHAEFGLRRENP